MEDRVNDKVKIKEILNEIDNLKKYTTDLANNTRGEKLESFVNNLNKNVNLLNNKAEDIYEKFFVTDIDE